MTERTPRPTRARLRWWGRLESRVIAALVALGVLCVGASAYLVGLTVAYFDDVVGRSMSRSDAAVEIAAAYYGDLVTARKEAYQARAAAFAAEVAAADDEAAAARAAAAIFAREADLVALTLRREGAAIAAHEREAALPEAGGAWIWVAPRPAATAGAAPIEVAPVFAMDPAVERRHQALGALRREAGLVAIGPRAVDRATLEVAVSRAIAAASALVLMVAFIAGFWLARATTRRVSELSEVMRRVAQGDLTARAGAGGGDELAELAAAFNRMLDELDAAQRKVVYLQRVSAWQDMARRIAHEIKNPLTPIQLAVQQLREKDPGGSPEFSRLLAESVEIVEDEVEALRRMVTSFSSFARVPEARPEPVAVARLLGEFERAYGHLTEEASDALEVVAAAEGIEVVGDRQLLKQCLVNLVENAVLSGREAGRSPLRVRIRAIPDAEAGMVELWVEDNGPGIPAAMRERAFDPYVSTRREGSGLGLAIVKKTVLDLGGEVRIDESELGGAAVILRLRLHR